MKIPNSFYSSTGPIGPLVLPGKYEVRLVANRKTLKQSLEVRLDPRINVSPSDLQKEFDLAWKVYESTSQLHTAINQIREGHAELARLKKRFGGDARLQPVVVAARDLDIKMDGIEQGMIQVNMKGSEANLAFPNQLNEKFDTFMRSVETVDGEPTKQQYEVFDYFNGQLQKLLADWRQVQTNDVQSLNALIRKYQVPFLAPGASEEISAGDGTGRQPRQRKRLQP